VDAGALTPEQASTTLREAQWILVDRGGPAAEPVTGAANPSSPSMAEIFAEYDVTLNRALAEQGITCRRGGKTLPC
jgi:hypothetical protein